MARAHHHPLRHHSPQILNHASDFALPPSRPAALPHGGARRAVRKPLCRRALRPIRRQRRSSLFRRNTRHRGRRLSRALLARGQPRRPRDSRRPRATVAHWSFAPHGSGLRRLPSALGFHGRSRRGFLAALALHALGRLCRNRHRPIASLARAPSTRHPHQPPRAFHRLVRARPQRRAPRHPGLEHPHLVAGLRTPSARCLQRNTGLRSAARRPLAAVHRRPGRRTLCHGGALSRKSGLRAHRHRLLCRDPDGRRRNGYAVRRHHPPLSRRCATDAPARRTARSLLRLRGQRR